MDNISQVMQDYGMKINVKKTKTKEKRKVMWEGEGLRITSTGN